MTDLAIRVENLGRRYHIGPRERYKALRDTLTGAVETRDGAEQAGLLASKNPPGADDDQESNDSGQQHEFHCRADPVVPLTVLSGR
jgi:hypothetical protein